TDGTTLTFQATGTVVNRDSTDTLTNKTISGGSNTISGLDASAISTGVLAAARGGAGTVTGALKANGSGLVTQAACADLSNAATSCSTDATNAANISSGTLPAARLPAPSATTLGGIQSAAAVSHQWINSISTA